MVGGRGDVKFGKNMEERVSKVELRKTRSEGGDGRGEEGGVSLICTHFKFTSGTSPLLNKVAKFMKRSRTRGAIGNMGISTSQYFSLPAEILDINILKSVLESRDIYCFRAGCQTANVWQLFS